MTGYRIERIGLQSRWRAQVGQVVGEAFGESADAVLRMIALTTAIDGTRPSVYFAAIEGDELIGFNAFIAHDLDHRGQPVAAYQSCWTATSARHRGKRVFQTIIAAAHEALRDDGGDVIIGWPNPQSEPLFVHKLQYRREASVKRRVPGPGAALFFDERPCSATGIGQNDAQLIALKRRRHGDRLFAHHDGDDLIWGVVRNRHTPVGAVPFFDVGGIRCAAGGSARLARAITRTLPFVAYWQIVSEARNAINPAIGAFRPSPTNPLIWYALSDRFTDPGFDFFAGIRDVY